MLLISVLLTACKSEEERHRDADIADEAEAFHESFSGHQYARIPTYQDTFTAIHQKIRNGEFECPVENFFDCKHESLFNNSSHPFSLMREFISRLEKRYPAEVAQIDSAAARAEAAWAESRRRSREYEAEQQTRECMEGEYRKAYSRGQSIEHGRDKALMECAHLIAP
jgi:hypothetical protein